MATERVHFRLIQMPCCGHLFCNVNPRFPSYCPACGKHVYAEIKACVLLSDDNATLKYTGNPHPPAIEGE